MILGTYHAHTEFCDGKSSAEEMILSAIDLGAAEIGLTPHSPIKGEDWSMSEEGLLEYKRTVTRLKDKYKDRITVFMGIEEDVISGTDTRDFDFVIGSVHSVFAEGKNLWVDLSPTEVRENVKKYFHSDSYKYTEAYFDSVKEVYEKTHCDIIGHFDLVTKFIERDPLFSPLDERYLKQRDEALLTLLNTPALFEVNTGAITRKIRSTAYPAENLLHILKKENARLILSSDSHEIGTLDGVFDETRRYLYDIGFRTVYTLWDGDFVPNTLI